MSGWEIGIVIVASVAVGWVVGIVMGKFTERGAWTMRAITKEKQFGTPHFCDGVFYYII